MWWKEGIRGIKDESNKGNKEEKKEERKIWSEYHEEVQTSFSYSTQFVVNMAVCLSFHLTDFILEVLIHISTTLTLMLVQLVQSQCDWCGTDSVTETLWFCSHDSVFRNIFTEHKVTQRETLIPISLLLPHHLAPFFSSPLPLNPVSCPKAQAAGWEVGGKRSQVPLFDRAVAAFVLQAKTLPQTCTNTSTALLVFSDTDRHAAGSSLWTGLSTCCG